MDDQLSCNLPDNVSPEGYCLDVPNLTIVGLYDAPACGKSLLLRQLKAYLGEQHYAFCEESEVIDGLVLGGLPAFKTMHPDEQYYWRERAITFISRQCRETNRVGVVTGHYSICDEGESPRGIFTDADSLCYTHIFYLDVTAKDVARHCLQDTSRSRSSMSVEYIEEWMCYETSMLKDLCLGHGILFGKVSSTPSLPDKVSIRLNDIRRHSEEENLARFISIVDQMVNSKTSRNLFWHLDYPESAYAECDIDTPLEELFSSEMGYSYKAFRQAMLRYEDIEYKFEVLCDGVASRVFIYPEFLALLHAAEKAAAKLLMTPSRNASVADPSLRAAHQDVCRCLAIECLADTLGVEELLGEKSTASIALMRGGEPVALGVSEVFAKAMFFHAKQPEDIYENALAGKKTVILVGSVVESRLKIPSAICKHWMPPFVMSW